MADNKEEAKTTETKEDTVIESEDKKKDDPEKKEEAVEKTKPAVRTPNAQKCKKNFITQYLLL